MRWRRLLGWSVTVILILCAMLSAIAFVYLGPVRSAEGRRYSALIHEAAKPLTAETVTLGKQTDKLIEQAPSGSLEMTKLSARSVHSQILIVRAELKKFESTARQFDTGTALPTSADHRNAAVLHARSIANVAQSHQTLDEYERFLVFLLKLKELEQPLTDTLALFNAHTDLNLLSGASSELRWTASTLRHQGSQIETLDTPVGLEEIRTRLTAVHNHAAAGFDALANGLSPPIDSQIYGAASQIEAATREHEEVQALFEMTLEKHPILNDVRELPEKTVDL